MSAVNEKFLIAIAIIVIGYLAKRTGLVSKKEGHTLNKIILNITLPALILKVFSDIQLNPKLLLLSLICIIYGIFMLFISKHLFKKEMLANKGVLIISTLGFNIGLFAYPFVESLWGIQGLQYMAIFDMGNAVLIFGLAYVAAVIYSPETKQIDVRYITWRMLTFLPLLSYIVALCISYFRIPLPQFATTMFGEISAANSVLVLLVLGIYLDFNLERSQLTSIMKATIVKYVAGLTVGITLYLFLPFDEMFKATVLLGLVLPTGMAIIPYAVQNKLNDKIAGGIVNLTNIISFLLMWIIFLLVQ